MNSPEFADAAGLLGESTRNDCADGENWLKSIFLVQNSNGVS
jgi:hypothetical protein